MTEDSNQMMWAYQRHFRLALETIAQGVLSKLGLKIPLSAWLVGVGADGKRSRILLSMESEEQEWQSCWFSAFESELENWVDRLACQAEGDLVCQEHRRRLAFQSALRTVLQGLGIGEIFVGYPEIVEDYLVAPLFRIRNEDIAGLPRPKAPDYKVGHRLSNAPDSLLDSAIEELLGYATQVLRGPQPGADLLGLTREYNELCRAAAKGLMQRVSLAVGVGSGLNLFECCNAIASLRHEGAGTKGRLQFCHPDQLASALKVEFCQTVPLTESGWSRKLVGVSSADNTLIVSGVGGSTISICGIGSAQTESASDQGETFFVEFTDHHRWQLTLNGECLMHVRYGLPSIPSDLVDRAYLKVLYREFFPDCGEEDLERFLYMADIAIEQRHGTMLVVTREAASEAVRLESQGTRVKPTLLTPELLRLVTSIDGAVLLEPAGLCHAVGVILDGPATPAGTPARGARYNSAIRYTSAHKACLILVVSEDGPVDIFPTKKPKVENRVTAQLRQLEELSQETSVDHELAHGLLEWLNQHRSYLNGTQCGALNECVESLRHRWDQEKYPTTVLD
jgi:Probable sensor domain DACNG/Probable sensor domain DACNH/DisA bacterial checkpoint controller nucleotide-binding